MTKRSYNKIIRTVYNAVEKSGLTSRKFHDYWWEGVSSIIRTVNDALEPLSMQYNDYFTYSIEEVKGYSNDGMTKTYNMEICNRSGEKIIGGNIVCYTAGTIQDPWSSYDLTCTFWNI